MSVIFGNEWFLIPLFGLTVFIFCYVASDRIISLVQERTSGTTAEVCALMKKMMLDVNEKRVFWIVTLCSFGLGGVMFLLLWPQIIPGLFLGGVTVFLGGRLPKLFMENLWQRRTQRLVNQMVDGLTIMANGIKAGQSLNQALERVVDNTSGPLAQEFELVLNKMRLGMSLEDALNEFGDRIPVPDVQMFVTSINILKETGGNLAETFTTIVTTIRERQKIEKKVQALTAQGTMQAIIISCVPFVIFFMFLLLDPGYVMPLLVSPLGWLALAMVVGLVIMGLVVMKKIVTIKV